MPNMLIIVKTRNEERGEKAGGEGEPTRGPGLDTSKGRKGLTEPEEEKVLLSTTMAKAITMVVVQRESYSMYFRQCCLSIAVNS